jgi:hypothetical protein
MLYAVLQPRLALAFVWYHLSSGNTQPRAALSRAGLPGVIFWAWERPEDFRFLSPEQAGIAFLAKTIYLQSPANQAGDAAGLGNSAPAFSVRPRLQPLRIAPGTPLIAVVRIENPGPSQFVASARQSGPSLRAISYNSAQRESLASEITALQSIPGITAIQIDFDAPASAHRFYAALLQDVRRKLPPSLPLSITALASWCIGDRWLSKLPPGTIDEAVPMLFRMGTDSADVVRFLRSGNDFPVPACQNSLGLSTDEPLLGNLLSGEFSSTRLNTQGKRIYVFAPHSWLESQASEILKELRP